MDISLSEFFNEDGEILHLSQREKKLVLIYRTLPDDKADLYFRLGKNLN